MFKEQIMKLQITLTKDTRVISEKSFVFRLFSYLLFQVPASTPALPSPIHSSYFSIQKKAGLPRVSTKPHIKL